MRFATFGLGFTPLWSLQLVVACTAAPDRATFDPAGGQEAGTSLSTGEAEPSGSSGAADTDPHPKLDLGDSGESGDCAQGTDAIHVLDKYDELWTFDPIAVEYEHFVTVDCALLEADALTGIAIDHRRQVWVMSRPPAEGAELPMRLSTFDSNTGECEEKFLGELGTNTGSVMDCADIAFVPAKPLDFTSERLFAHACTSGGLALLDLDLQPLYRFDPAEPEPSFTFLARDRYTSAPLAGTGDGRLYAMSGTQEGPDASAIIQYDQTDGSHDSLATIDLDVGESGPFIALAFYAGDLYFFGFSDQVDVHRYDLDDDDGTGLHELVRIDGGERTPFADGILAAASPTCIPLVPAG